MKERALQEYFDELGSAGFDLKEFESDEEAASFLPAYTDNATWHAREEFLWEVLSSCGWMGERTEEPFDSIPGLSTTYLSWWADKPREIVKTLRAKPKRILLEAGVKVQSLSRAKREKEEIERLVEGFARLKDAEAKHLLPMPAKFATAATRRDCVLPAGTHENGTSPLSRSRSLIRRPCAHAKSYISSTSSVQVSSDLKSSARSVPSCSREKFNAKLSAFPTIIFASFSVVFHS
jgi:hypothetical protein